HLFILFRFWPEHRVDLVKQDRGRSGLTSNFAEQVSGGNIHSHYRAGHKQFRDFKCARFTRSGLWREERESRGGVPEMHQVRMNAPQSVGGLRVLSGIRDKSPDEVVDGLQHTLTLAGVVFER